MFISALNRCYLYLQIVQSKNKINIHKTFMMRYRKRQINYYNINKLHKHMQCVFNISCNT